MQRIADLTPIISETIINNEDISVTANGEYTASEGYTGLGTVTVNVPATPQKNYVNFGATVTNGIASNFSGNDSDHVTWGGIGIKTNINYFTNRFTTFQIAFTMPEVIPEWTAPCGTPYPNKAWGASGGDNDLIINAHTTENQVKLYGLGFNSVEMTVSFSPNTYYIMRFTRNTLNNGVFISSDGGETFTQIYSSPPNDFVNMRNTQFGYYAGYNNSNVNIFGGTIDLKKTGFLNLNTDETYMLEE